MRKLILLLLVVCTQVCTTHAQIQGDKRSTVWSYDTSKNEMTDSPMFIASISADYLLELPKGNYYATLTISKTEQAERVTLISDDHCHFMKSDNIQFVNMRFDEEPMISVNFTYINASKPYHIEFEDPGTLIAKIKHAHVLRIQAKIEGMNSEVMRFHVSGLNSTKL